MGMKCGRCYRREAFVGVDAFSGEYLVAIEDLKETSHAPHLFVCVARSWFVELVVIARAVWGADFAVCSGCSLVLARCHFE